MQQGTVKPLHGNWKVLEMDNYY